MAIVVYEIRISEGVDDEEWDDNDWLNFRWEVEKALMDIDGVLSVKRRTFTLTSLRPCP